MSSFTDVVTMPFRFASLMRDNVRLFRQVRDINFNAADMADFKHSNDTSYHLHAEGPTYRQNVFIRKIGTRRGIWPASQNVAWGGARISSSRLNFKSKMSRRRPRKRRRMGGSSMAKLALRKVRKLERKVEVKFFDNPFQTIASISTTGDIRNIAQVVSGNSFNNRDGNHITPFRLNFRFHWGGIAGGTTDVYRTIIFRDKRQLSGSGPIVLDVLAAASPIAQIKGINHSRYKILFDHTFSNPNDTAIFQNFVGHVSIRMSLQMGWLGTSGGDINQNGLFMLNITNLTTNLPSLKYSTRMFFNDL